MSKNLLKSYYDGNADEITGGFEKRKKRNNSLAQEKRAAKRAHEEANFISCAKKGVSMKKAW